MNRRYAITISAFLAILMVAGVLWFVFQPQKPVRHRQAQRISEVVGVGIALRVNTRTHEILVQDVVPKSPASEAGITQSVIINRVDDISLAGMKLMDAANLIRGPVGTTVKLELVTPDHSQTNTMTLTRRKLQL